MRTYGNDGDLHEANCTPYLINLLNETITHSSENGTSQIKSGGSEIAHEKNICLDYLTPSLCFTLNIDFVLALTSDIHVYKAFISKCNPEWILHHIFNFPFGSSNKKMKLNIVYWINEGIF